MDYDVEGSCSVLRLAVYIQYIATPTTLDTTQF